jgi:hypothetical protein
VLEDLLWEEYHESSHDFNPDLFMEYITTETLGALNNRVILELLQAGE